jgi:hypothetical protein
MRRVRAHITYANVMASLAMFVALGGTTYAVASLPRNSVGASQIRPNSVGKSEIRRGAVRSTEVRDRSVQLQDISLSARASLRGRPGPVGPMGPMGPPGVPLSAAVEDSGRVSSGTPGVAVEHPPGTSNYDVRFNQDLRACRAVAAVPDEDPKGQAIVTLTDRGAFVRTRNSSGAPTELPFHLIVVC